MSIFKSNNADEKKLLYRGAANALGVLAYVSLVVLFMNNANKIFGQGDNPMIGVIMLLILVLSASVTGSLVLGKPILLYLDGKKAEAVKMLVFTMLSLFIILTLVISGYLGLK